MQQARDTATESEQGRLEDAPTDAQRAQCAERERDEAREQLAVAQAVNAQLSQQLEHLRSALVVSSITGPERLAAMLAQHARRPGYSPKRLLASFRSCIKGRESALSFQGGAARAPSSLPLFDIDSHGNDCSDGDMDDLYDRLCNCEAVVDLLRCGHWRLLLRLGQRLPIGVMLAVKRFPAIAEGIARSSDDEEDDVCQVLSMKRVFDLAISDRVYAAVCCEPEEQLLHMAAAALRHGWTRCFEMIVTNMPSKCVDMLVGSLPDDKSDDADLLAKRMYDLRLRAAAASGRFALLQEWWDASRRPPSDILSDAAAGGDIPMFTWLQHQTGVCQDDFAQSSMMRTVFWGRLPMLQHIHELSGDND